MILRYQSGIEIKKGDHVLFHGEPGEIEMVASELGDQKLSGMFRSSAGAWGFLSRRFLVARLSQRISLGQKKIWNL